MAMGDRPLTGYHVYAFMIPLLMLTCRSCSASTGRLAGELIAFGTYFALAVVWDYLWFVLNPAYTVRRFRKGNVWWFEQPWIWRVPDRLLLGHRALASCWRAGRLVGRQRRRRCTASCGCWPGWPC